MGVSLVKVSISARGPVAGAGALASLTFCLTGRRCGCRSVRRTGLSSVGVTAISVCGMWMTSGCEWSGLCASVTHAFRSTQTAGRGVWDAVAYGYVYGSVGGYAAESAGALRHVAEQERHEQSPVRVAGGVRTGRGVGPAG